MSSNDILQFCGEILGTYGLTGLVIVLLIALFIVIIYKLGPKIFDKWDELRETAHRDKMLIGLKRAPKIQAVLRGYLKDTKLDHLFVAELHNGTKGIGGVPYLKFDIIFDQINPKYHGKDRVMSYVYENEHVMAHDQLPELLIQNKFLSYNVEELENIDEALYIAMTAREIQSICLYAITNKKNITVGFVGGLSFDEDNNNEQFVKCAKEIENIYNS